MEVIGKFLPLLVTLMLNVGSISQIQNEKANERNMLTDPSWKGCWLVEQGFFFVTLRVFEKKKLLTLLEKFILKIIPCSLLIQTCFCCKDLKQEMVNFVDKKSCKRVKNLSWKLYRAHCSFNVSVKKTWSKKWWILLTKRSCKRVTNPSKLLQMLKLLGKL